jgi:hypothetical protein
MTDLTWYDYKDYKITHNKALFGDGYNVYGCKHLNPDGEEAWLKRNPRMSYFKSSKAAEDYVDGLEDLV